MERSFFDHVRDALEGFVDDAHGPVFATAHRRGVKVWFGTTDGRAAKEHYEAQLIRHAGDAALEIGFHAEHNDQATNEAIVATITAKAGWRAELGDEAEAGPFLGMGGWTRISEVWPPPDPDDPEQSIEVAARLADYIDTIEPRRMGD